MSEIYAALAAVMADVDHVAKRDRNEHQRFLFRGIDAVVNAVGPVLRKHGVIVVPDVESVDYETVQTTGGKPSTACRVLARYTFYAGDGSSVSARVAAEAWDSGDKAAPKAMSVAFRTALLQALALPTDEPDPDAATYEREAQAAPAPARRMSRPATVTTLPTAASAPQVTAVNAVMTTLGIADRESKLAWLAAELGRPITSSKDLTAAEAHRILDTHGGQA